MISKESLSAVKQATVAIGLLAGPDNTLYSISGSGFFISTTGYVMTATHVAQDCADIAEKRKIERNEMSQMVAVRLISSVPNASFQLQMIPLDSPIRYIKLIRAGSDGQDDVDVAIARPIDRMMSDLPHLEIMKPGSLNLYHEIALCGYPSGKYSLNMQGDPLELRFSPTMQFGRLSGFIPYDSAEYPSAIQTDIVGTAGSSGSPIVDLETAKVIGLAQRVLPADVTGFTFMKMADGSNIRGTVFASSNIGLVYGISHNLLHGLPEAIKEVFEKGTPIKHNPKFTAVFKKTTKVEGG